MSTTNLGNLQKWVITSGANEVAGWYVCPALIGPHHNPRWGSRPIWFATGKEALAAFAAGGDK